jgi:hypothetical protein
MFKYVLLLSFIYIIESKGNRENRDSNYLSNDKPYIQLVANDWPAYGRYKLRPLSPNFDPVYFNNWENNTIIPNKTFDISPQEVRVKQRGIYIFYGTFTFDRSSIYRFQNAIKVYVDETNVLTGVAFKVQTNVFALTQVHIYGILNIKANQYVSIASRNGEEILFTDPSLTHWGLIKL